MVPRRPGAPDHFPAARLGRCGGLELLAHLPGSFTQPRYVTVELKVGRLCPACVGSFGTFVAVVDDRVRDHGVHTPTVGLLLCPGRDEQVSATPWASASAPSPTQVPRGLKEQPRPSVLAVSVDECLEDDKRETHAGGPG